MHREKTVIAVASGANGQLLVADLATAEQAFAGVQVAILQLEIPLESVTWAARRASQAGCRVLLNPAPMPPAGLPDALLHPGGDPHAE